MLNHAETEHFSVRRVTINLERVTGLTCVQ